MNTADMLKKIILTEAHDFLKSRGYASIKIDTWYAEKEESILQILPIDNEKTLTTFREQLVESLTKQMAREEANFIGRLIIVTLKTARALA